MSIWSVVKSFNANKPVEIPTSEGNIKHTDFVSSNVPEANEGFWYYNKYLIGSGHFQTKLASGSYDVEYPVWYGRRYFNWTDGSQICVDYALDVNSAEPKNWTEDVKYLRDPDTPTLPKRTRVLQPEELVALDDPHSTTPLFINVHGLTGGSHENYIRAVICELRERSPGIEICVITSRGCNRSKITTPQLFNGAWTEDLRQLVKHVTTVQPLRPIFLAGYSLGGSILANYLGQEGTDVAKQVKAAVVVGNPWDLLLCHVSLESSFLGRHIYNPIMAANLCRVVKNNRKELDKNELARTQAQKVGAARTVFEFDETMTAPIFGFNGAMDYYRHGSSINRIRGISVPTLVLASKDDPICGDICVPYADAKANPYIHLVVTTHGGHLGWFQQNGQRWYSNVLSKYIASFVSHAKLDENAIAPSGPARTRWFQNGRFQVNLQEKQ